jgi:hypothetical protein
LLKLGVKIQTLEYDNIYASRSVIKNNIVDFAVNPLKFKDVRIDAKKAYIKEYYRQKIKSEMSDDLYRIIFPEDNIDTKRYSDPKFFDQYVNGFSTWIINELKINKGYYKEDIWGIANHVIKPYLEKGMTIYAEIVGYTPSGALIQKNDKYHYDYGYKKPEKGEIYIEGIHYGIYIYRITLTNQESLVYELSAQQVQQWCKDKNLKPVVELYYGAAGDLFQHIFTDLETWQNRFLQFLKITYLEKDCPYCKVIPNTPDEGIVLRKEIIGLEVFKLKSIRFLESESKQLDKGEIDIESEQTNKEL